MSAKTDLIERLQAEFYRLISMKPRDIVIIGQDALDAALAHDPHIFDGVDVTVLGAPSSSPNKWWRNNVG